MADMHLTRELLHALARGEISGQVLEERVLEHLTSLCPYCNRELTAFNQEQEATTPGMSQSNSFAALSVLLDRHLHDLGREQDRARKAFEELLALPMEEAIAKVKRSRTRFRGQELVWQFLQESRRKVTTSPDEARQLAELARVILQYSPYSAGAVDLLALATAHLANACRAGSKFPEADSYFEYVRSLTTHHDVTDTGILARIDHLEGSLRMDQNRFHEAEKLLRRAAMLFSVVGESIEQARTLITLGSMFFLQGELVQAVETTKAGLRGLPLQEKHLYLCGRYNLARFLTESGEYREALEILQEDEELHREFPEPWTQLRLIWLRGKIAAGQGDPETAERHFLTARAGFLAQPSAYDAAMVSLEDLALLYLHQGRTAEVRHLAEEMITVFQEQNLPDDALRALKILAAAETLTAALVRECAARIRKVAAGRVGGVG